MQKNFAPAISSRLCASSRHHGGRDYEFGDIRRHAIDGCDAHSVEHSSGCQERTISQANKRRWYRRHKEEAGAYARFYWDRRHVEAFVKSKLK